MLCCITDCCLFYYAGLFIVLSTLITIVRGLYPLILHRFKQINLPERYGRNSFVLVTGASDGIGKAFCHHFAGLGFNLIMVARNKEKLEGVKREILRVNSGCDIRIVVKDFKQSLQPGFYDDF